MLRRSQRIQVDWGTFLFKERIPNIFHSKPLILNTFKPHTQTTNFTKIRADFTTLLLRRRYTLPSRWTNWKDFQNFLSAESYQTRVSTLIYPTPEKNMRRWMFVVILWARYVLNRAWHALNIRYVAEWRKLFHNFGIQCHNSSCIIHGDYFGIRRKDSLNLFTEPSFLERSHVVPQLILQDLFYPCKIALPEEITKSDSAVSHLILGETTAPIIIARLSICGRRKSAHYSLSGTDSERWTPMLYTLLQKKSSDWQFVLRISFVCLNLKQFI